MQQRLTAAKKGRLILVSAPAGFGKTTLVTEWLEHVGDERFAVAWLSLDEGDLRFTPGERNAPLNEVMYLNLDPNDLSVLERRTECWHRGGDAGLDKLTPGTNAKLRAQKDKVHTIWPGRR